MDDLIETLPERRGIDPGARNDFIDDEVMEDFRNLQTGNGYALNFRHPDVSMFGWCCIYRVGSAA